MRTLQYAIIVIFAAWLHTTQTHGQVVLKADSATVAQWIERADSGDAVAQNKVGIWYYTGVGGLEKSYAEALRYWQMAARQNQCDAIGNIAMCYQLGNGVEADSTEAVRYYTDAIAKGNSRLLMQHERLADKEKLFSMMLLYDIYYHGKAGQAADIEKGRHYLEKAAEAGVLQAQQLLVRHYLGSKQYAEAAPWLKVLADKGDADGLFQYGQLLLAGRGTAADQVAAMSCFEQAAAKGYAPADGVLGELYYKGQGVGRDIAKALPHLKVAAAANDGQSQLLLAACYLDGTGVAADYAIATHWFCEAFANGHADEVTRMVEGKALFRTYLLGLSSFYRDDYETARILFKSIEKAGRQEGLVMQACCLAADHNPDRNPKKALKLMTEAAATSSAIATVFLADMYRLGVGTKADKLKASQLIDEARRQSTWYLPFDPYVAPRHLNELLQGLK